MQILRAAALVLSQGCDTPREPLAPSYRDDIAPLMAAKCVSCHSGPTPAGGFRATTYLDVIGCANGTPVTVGADPKLLRVLASPSHAGVADARELLAKWLARGAPAFNGATHPAAFIDPRSPGRHGKFLRDRQWKPMLDVSHEDACGRCHDGAPARAASSAAPGATACTSCHTEPEGVLACTTCHGDTKPYPPRDACFFPGESGGAHAAHLEPSPSATSGVACASCHPVPKTGAPAGTHGDGVVQVLLASGTFDPGTRVCSGTCHAGKGALRPTPAWTDPPMKCGDCHGAPPPMHLTGACASCHQTPLHLNGKVDLGDGSGKCGACHGKGDDPRPSTGAHAKHAFDCDTCHVLDAPHPNGALTVRMLGLAARGGRMPTFDATAKTCASTYCHDQPGGSARTPKWTDTGINCNSCHSSPPPAPHTTGTTCGTTGCHNAALPPASTKHVNGAIDL